MKQGLVVAAEAVVSASRIMRSLRSSLPSVILSATLMMLAIAPDAGAQSASSQGYLLWTRSDTGQAVLWQVDPVTGGLIKSITVGPSAGMGASWKATSIQYVGTSAYVLWTRSDTGQAELWTIDPATGSKLKSASLQSETGIGGPWQATSYYHVNSTEGYVLWTRSDLGKASLWRIDPSKLETLSVIPAETTAYLFSESGVGAPWEATSYHHVSATEGYVLWTRSDIGKANLWQIDPSLPTGPSQLKRSQSLYSAAGVGAPWQATSYTHMGSTEGYVLWTRSDSGKTTLWQVDPSQPTGQGQLKRSLILNSAAGMSAPWQATSYAQRELTSGVVLSGSTDPTDDIGRIGDLYLNTATATLFGPKTFDGWGVGTWLAGPQGPKGDPGAPGAKGDPGAPGTPGGPNVSAYSGDAEYLGLLLGQQEGGIGGWLQVFIPSLSKIIRIREQDGTIPPGNFVNYSGLNCTGTIYLPFNTTITPCGLGTYCAGDNQLVTNPTIQSYRADPYNNDCTNGGDTRSYAYVGKTVTLPFSVPVALPISAQAITGVAQCGTYNGHKYFCSTATISWGNAINLCNSFGAYLAEVADQAENDAITSFITTAHGGAAGADSTIGLYEWGDVEGNWHWNSGDPLTYSNWGEGGPNNVGGVENVAEIVPLWGGQWNDYDGREPNHFVCEKE